VSARVSGLSDDHAAHARSLIARAARVMVQHKNEISYSQRLDRMVGIRNELTITKGEFPRTCDCSSTAKWMLWDAMARPYEVRDLVSHQNWVGGGWTGNMYMNGKRVVHDANLKVGDLIYYGNQGGGVPEHVAVYIGGGMVFSHGSQGGPYLLSMDYRSDRRLTRRYI
jgi:NlpC/P60 family